MMAVSLAAPLASTVRSVSALDRESSGPGPRLSVVVAWPDNEERLGALLGQRLQVLRASDVDLVVVTREAVSDHLAARCRGVRFLSAPADVTVGDMRELGVRHAVGDVVVIVDDVSDTRMTDSICAGWTANPRRRL